MDFREGARHHHVVARCDKLDAGLVVVALHVFGIGGVEHQQHMAGQAPMQPFDFVERQIGSGRVVRVGQEHHLGARRDRFDDGVHVGGIVPLWHRNGLCAGAQGRDRIDQKAVDGMDRLVAVGEIGASEQVEQVVGAGAAHDAVGIEPEGAADGLTQRGGGALRVILQMIGDRMIGRDRLRTGAERRFVGGEFIDLRRAPRFALAGHVGVDG